MVEDDDDFTFPTVLAAAREPAPAPALPEGRQLGGMMGPAGHLLRHRLPVPPGLVVAATTSPLWPFAGSPKAPETTAPVAAGEEMPEARVSGSSSGREAEEDEARRANADEERMDLLWEWEDDAATIATAPATRSTGSGPSHAERPPTPKPKMRPNPPRTEADAGDKWQHAEPPPKPKPSALRADDKRRAAAVADAERMDKLWESFNEELLLLRQRHARSKSAGGLDPADRCYLCNFPPSEEDAESKETTAASSPAERRGYGCAPTMLRASSRAGGAGPFCGGGSSSRGDRRRGAAGGWALLLRLFRRLFAVHKAPAAASTCREPATMMLH